MSTEIVCDGCGTRVPLEGSISFTGGAYGGRARDFCTRACLDKKLEQEEQAAIAAKRTHCVSCGQPLPRKG